MEKLNIIVTDAHTKNVVLRLLQSIDGVKVNQTRSSHIPDPAASLRSLAGIWKDRDISLQEIRDKAWKRSTK